MKRLIFIVEGETELEFVNRLLIPFLTVKGLTSSMNGIIITMSGGGHGYNNIEHFKNTIRPILSMSDEPIITTLIDHYGINSEKKLIGYTECIQESDVEERIKKMEEKLNEAVQSIKPYRFFIPYIQRHEFETLLFADPEKGFDLEDRLIKQDVISLCNSFTSIEDINCTPEGAPSKRLKIIYERHNKVYEKVTDAVDIAELTTIDKLLEECPRFRKWIETLLLEVKKS